jgi:hypothetical protein
VKTTKAQRREMIVANHGGFSNASDDNIDRMWSTLTPAKRKEYRKQLSEKDKEKKSKQKK